MDAGGKKKEKSLELDSFPLPKLFWTIKLQEAAMGGMLAVWFLRYNIILGQTWARCVCQFRISSFRKTWLFEIVTGNSENKDRFHMKETKMIREFHFILVSHLEN